MSHVQEGGLTAPTPQVSDYIYLDAENLVVGARRHTQRPDWTMDYRRLYAFLGGQTCRSATLYNARRDRMTASYDAAYVTGFDVVLGRVNEAQREKGVDLAMAIDVIEDACTDASVGDRFVLCTGDGDFLPVVEKLRERRMHVTVACWGEDVSARLRHAATRFLDLTPHRDFLRYDATHYLNLGNQR